MKNLSYLIILLFAITLSSCGDMNEFTPTVQAPDAEWKMSFVNTIPGSSNASTQGVPEKFEPKFDYTNRTLTINHTFHDDARAIFDRNPVVNIVSTVSGPQIEITYKQIDFIPLSTTNVLVPFPFTHSFTFAEVGRGKTARIPVIVRRTYMHPSLFGFDKVDNVRYINP